MISAVCVDLRTFQRSAAWLAGHVEKFTPDHATLVKSVETSTPENARQPITQYKHTKEQQGKDKLLPEMKNCLKMAKMTNTVTAITTMTTMTITIMTTTMI